MANIERFTDAAHRVRDFNYLERATTLKAWELPKQESSVAPAHVWSNIDQDPVPDERRTWTAWTYSGYWASDLVTISTWEASSSILAVGLSTTDAILIMLVAGICNAVPTVMNGAIGADLRIPFPVAIRSSFGYWFSYFAVFSRGILALFWFGVQSVGGGQAMEQVITSIWPSFARLPNQLPASAGVTTSFFIGYVIYHIVQLPFLLIPTHRMQPMFLAKAILVPPMALGMVIWICVKSAREGHSTASIFYQPATVSGSTRAWLWLNSLTSITGGYATLAVNIPDFSRFSKNRGSQWWQLPIIPLLKVITSLFGIIATGAAYNVYPNEKNSSTINLWDPISLVAKWTSPSGRLAAFVCSSLWVLAQITCNVSANSVSFANDLTSMFPKWINIKRGVIVAAVVGGWAMVPWIMVTSAYTFLNFMSGYAIFLGPFAGILLADYWIVKRRRIDVPALYDPVGRYRYFYGLNWRALLIEILVVPPLLPGLAYEVTPTTKFPIGLSHLYSINWLYGFFMSMVLYTGLSWAFPARETLVERTISGVPKEHERSGSVSDEKVDLDEDEKRVGERASEIPDEY